MLLSVGEVTILSLISKMPTNAYQIEQFVECAGGGRWIDVNVFYALKKFNSQDLVKGEEVREGHRPPKTIYTITQKGREILAKELKNDRFVTVNYHSAFDSVFVALSLSGVLSSSESVDIVKKRRDFLMQKRQKIISVFRELGDSNAPPTYQTAIYQRSVASCEAELDWLEQALTDIEKVGWEKFVTANLQQQELKTELSYLREV